MSPTLATGSAVAQTEAPTWGRALGLTGLTLWLPCLLPVLFGVLRESGSALSIYATCVPMVPGSFVGYFAVLSGCKSSGAMVASAVGTVLLFGAMFLACWRLPPRRLRLLHLLQGVVIVGVAIESFAVAELALH